MGVTTNRDIDHIIAPTGAPAPAYEAWLGSPERMSSPRCSVEFRFSGERTSLKVRGDLDADSLPALSTQIDQVVCTPCREVVLDLTAARSLDALACRVVVGLHHYVTARGGELTVLCEAPALRRRLALYRLPVS